MNRIKENKTLLFVQTKKKTRKKKQGENSGVFLRDKPRRVQVLDNFFQRKQRKIALLLERF